MLSYNGTAAPSHRELMRMYQAVFDARVAAGEIRPMIFPHDAYSLFALIIYLCIPHVNRPWLYAARWLLLAFIVVSNIKLMLEARSTYGGTGFGVGLIAAWGIVWSMTWLVWSAPQFDAKRVQRRKRKTPSVVAANLQVNGDGKAIKIDKGLRRRQPPNGHIKAEKAHEEEIEKAAQPEYYWQSYPVDSLRDRISWVSDLIFNFRGSGWNWELPTNPSLPAHVKVGLGEPIDLKSMKIESSVGIKRFSSTSELIRAQVPRFIIGYLMLDGLKVILMKDPYFFLGPNNFPPPAHIASFSPTMILIYRQILSLLAIITALETVFLEPLFFCLILGPKILGTRGEHWMYPTTWGSLEMIFTKGLQGLWGGWWHQTFRHAFTAPTDFLIRHKLLAPKSSAAKFVSLAIAFAMSGFLHSSGSYTQFPSTIPTNPILFFMLQAVGILVQSSFCEVFQPWIRSLPMNVRRSANFAFAFTWLFCTSALLIDDFARGGVWLFQPVPVSPLRGLGYGVEGDGWWCWEDIRVRWHTGRSWWEMGWALM